MPADAAAQGGASACWHRRPATLPGLTLPLEIRELLREVSQAVASLGPAEPVKVRKNERDMVAIFDRCRSGLGAIRLLADNGFAEEAVSIARQVFTESLMLTEISGADERRRWRIMLGWTRAALRDWEGIYRDAESLHGEDVTEVREAIQSAHDELSREGMQHGVSSRSWKLDEKGLAKKQGRVEEFLGFRVSHHFVHGSSFAARWRWSESDGVVYVGGPAAETGRLATEAGLFAAKSTLLAARAIGSIMGWEEPPDLQGLLERVERATDGR